MKRSLLAVIGGVLVLVGAGLVFVGPQSLLLLLNYPRHGFDEDPPAVAPDYASPEAWELYGENGAANSELDVFFIHPTGYFRGDHWNSRLDPDSAATYNRRWMMANMASVFDDFTVYAPRYREATIYAFFDADDADSHAALELAYSDVLAAFEHFLQHVSRGRPFILAGHSQGTLHGLRLLRRLEESPDAGRLVVAYLPGGTQNSMTEGVRTPLCGSARHTTCFVAWSTYDASYAAEDHELTDPYVCVNPVSWTINGSADIRQHLGMVPEVGRVNLRVLGEDKVPYLELPALSAPLPGYTAARCEQGLLRVNVPDRGSFHPFTPGDYHNYDYSLFHADVRANAKLRAEHYLRGQ